MDWAKLLLAGVQVLAYLLKYASDRQLIDAGQKQALAALLRAQADVIDEAKKAREEARARNNSVPKSDSLPTDGYRRD